MISFRYHIVSLVAVFFAMAIGVVIGTSVISDQLIEQLEDQRVHDRAELKAERERTEALEGELQIWDRVGKARLTPAMEGKLEGRQVVLLSGIAVTDEKNPVAGVHDALEDAGATIAARISFTSRWKLTEEDERATLATTIGSRKTDQPDLLVDAARVLSTRLRQTAPPSGADVLELLSDAGFLKITDRNEQAFPPRGAAFVYVEPSGTDVVPSGSGFTYPLLTELARAGIVAATEPWVTNEGFTERVTASADTRERIVTVDHIDTEPGIYSLIIGLADVFAGKPAGHYGTGERTSGVLPA